MIGIMIIAMTVSIKIHRTLDTNIESNFFTALKCLNIILIILDAAIVIIEFLCERASKKSKLIFQDVIVNLKQKTKRYSQTNSNKINSVILIKTISVYLSDKDIVNDGINLLIDSFNTSYEKGGISYFILKNQTNEVVFSCLRNNREFQNDCEKTSEIIVNDILMNLDDFDSTYITFGTLYNLSMGILHLSLPYNNAKEDKVIHCVRSIIDWMYHNIDEDNMMVYKTEITTMLISLLELKKKTDKFENKCLNEDYDRLQRSSFVKELSKKAKNSLDDKKFFDTILVKPDECIWITNILTAYPNFNTFCMQCKMNNFVKELNKQVINNYSSCSEDMCASIIYLSSMLVTFFDDKKSDASSLMAMAVEYYADIIDKMGE